MLNTDEYYGLIARFLHWSLGLAVLVLIATAVFAELVSSGSLRDRLYEMHRGLAVLILPLIVARLVWRLIDPPPPPAAWLLPVEQHLSKAVHLSLIALIVLQPATGLAMYLLDGEAIDVFGWFGIPAVVIPVPAVAAAARLVHEWAAWPLYLAVALHLGAVFIHFVVKRDHTLARMTALVRKRAGT